MFNIYDHLLQIPQKNTDMAEAVLQVEHDSEYEYDYHSDDSYSSDYSSSEYELTAQEQWEESLRQISSLMNLIIFPLVGKIVGRRVSHTIWAKFADWWFD